MVSEFGQYHTKCFAVLAWSLAFIQTYSSAGIWAIRRLCADNTETRSWKLKTIILNFAYQNRFSMLNRSHHCIISFILHERLERNFECVCKWNYSEIHHLLHSFYISEFNQNLNKKISITLKSSVIQKPRDSILNLLWSSPSESSLDPSFSSISSKFGGMLASEKILWMVTTCGFIDSSSSSSSLGL